MDDTELHYLTYDPDEIMAAMMLAYVEAGGSVIRAGDEKEMLLRGVQNIMTLAFAGIDNALRMSTLRYAVGEYLDRVGEARDCYRMEATNATATVTITYSATGDPVTIPAGALLTQDGQFLYETDEDIILPGTAGTLTVAITAEIAGAKGNSLLQGAEMQFLTNYEGVVSVVCATAATGGQNGEDDETYRDRIRTFGLSAITTGPAEQYRSAALAVSSEIIDAAPINGGGGTVNVYLLPASSDGTAALIAAVETALSATDTRPLTDHVVVQLATAKTYTLNVKYSANSGMNVSSAIAEAVQEYQNWQEHTIGRAFNPDKLLASLYAAGCSRVFFGSGSAFNGGTVEYTEINPNEYCKGTITLAVVDE